MSSPEKANCTGCYACAAVCPERCISLENDPEGFWYPSVDETKCIDCGGCEAVCPLISQREVESEPTAYACIGRDEAVRLDSSSGGVFTLLAERIIDRGGVVFGAGFNGDFSVSHSFVETKEDLARFRGSKYVQSGIKETFGQAKDFLEEGREVLFSGTPCQIAGLQSYLDRSYDNLLSVDIICHGVPSPKVWQKYIAYRENQAGEKARRIAFRDKVKGWKRFSLSVEFSDQKRYSQTFERDYFMQAFLKNICLRPSCYSCAFKSLHRPSDITLGDFWGVQSILPDMDDDKGTSLIFVNSARGRSMFSGIKGDMRCQEVDIEQSVRGNSAATRSVASHGMRETFLRNSMNCLSTNWLSNTICPP